jgi:hypothetical protein
MSFTGLEGVEHIASEPITSNMEAAGKVVLAYPALN